jgi:hypothetical protein
MYESDVGRVLATRPRLAFASHEERLERVKHVQGALDAVHNDERQRAGFVALQGTLGDVFRLRHGRDSLDRLLDLEEVAMPGRRRDRKGRLGERGAIDRLEPPRLECRAHPPGVNRTEPRPTETHILVPERRELCAGHEPDVHELDLVEHPKRVLVEKAVLHRPRAAARAVPPIERAREQHVLRPEEN